MLQRILNHFIILVGVVFNQTGVNMYKKILIVCDLEGVNHVVGVPYEKLSKGSEQWMIAQTTGSS